MIPITAAAFLAAAGLAHSVARAQGPALLANPVYMDDSPAAQDAEVRVRELLAAGNADEAARVLQSLLEQQGDRVIASSGDADLLVAVRARVHQVLRSQPALLERYRQANGPRAEALLAQQDAAQVERAFLLTPAGFDAALAIAQDQLEDAEFESARLTLTQLDAHPDASGERAAKAAALWSLLARYLDRADVSQARDRWRRLASSPGAPPAPVPWPARARGQTRSAVYPLPALETSGLVAKPLWTVEYVPARRREEAAGGVRGGRAPAGMGAAQRSLHTIAASADDLVLINDGASVTAWDRFTLTARWTYALEAAQPPDPRRDRRFGFERWNYGLQGLNEEPACVSVSGRYVLAALGRGVPGSSGDDRVAAFDLATGRLLWAAGMTDLDPGLADAAVRGPIEIVGNTAILGVRKLASERRLVSLSLMGVDVRTGKARWTRQIGATGSMPWVTGSSGAEAMLHDRGIVYRVDRLGVIAALEAGNGRVRWVRRLPVDPTNQADPPASFQFGRPVLDGETIIVLAPDGRSVKRLDADTGAILASRPIGEFGSPEAQYFVRCGGHLVGVAADRVHVVPIATFDKAARAASPAIEEPGIRGRVLVAGERVIVPMTGGVQIIDPAKADAPETLALDESGNVLALDSQLIVVDDARVHSFLKWDTAERLLKDRMQGDPRDPQAAITLAELAYRADRPTQIAPAVEAAMTTLKAGADGAGDEARQSGRSRLFNVVHHIVATATDTSGAPPGKPPGPARLDAGLLTSLVERLGELASDPPQKVAHALAVGRVAELSSRGTEAAAAYQRVLLDPALASAGWRGLGVTVRGEIEATRRLEDLIRAQGAGVYAQQDALAAGELGALGAQAPVEALESLAARYPFASHVPGLWLRIADLHRAQERPRQQLAALESGLRGAQRLSAPDLTPVGHLAGLLVEELQTRGQLSAAAATLRTVKAKFPGAALSAGGKTIDTERLAAHLLESIAAHQRWPRVGTVQAQGGQALPGWTLMEPLLRDPTPSTPVGLALSGEEEVALWTAPQAPASEGQLVQAWSDKLEGRDARLIKITSDAAYFLIVGDDGATLTKAAPAPPTGGKAWSVDAGPKVFGSEDTRGLRRVAGVMNDRFDTPTERGVSPADMLVAMDDRTIVLAQRGGKIAGFDVESGELLWSVRSPLSRVHDCDLAAGWLALAGVEEAQNAAGAVVDLRPSVQVFDARSGRLSQRAGELKGPPHWVKFAESGALIVGAETLVASYDVWTGQINWTITGEQVMPAAAAWTMGDHLVLLSAERRLVMASIASGRLRPEALATPKSLLEGTRIIDVYPLGVGPTPSFGVATQQGVAFFSGEGALVGADGLGGTTALVPPRPAEGRAVTVETISDGRAGEGSMFFSLLAFATPSGAAAEKQTVLLGSRPTDIALMDGRVAVTAGTVTVVMPAGSGHAKQP